jgi:hypothetical protein
MPELRRTRDGAGDAGARSEAIAWNEDGTFKEIVGRRPTIGCSLLVGSVVARSYSNQDFWLTTPVTEILEEEERTGEEDGYYCKFKTGNSIYEYWEGNTGLWDKTVKKIKKLKNEKRTTDKTSD